jgi:hypothetical protein
MRDSAKTETVLVAAADDDRRRVFACAPQAICSHRPRLEQMS